MSNLASRRVPIGDSLNARHIGDYAAGGGRRTRSDRLFRAGWFELADDTAVERLVALDIRQVIDFRTPDEFERRPLAIGESEGVEVVSLPILSGNMRAYIDDTAHMAADEIDCRAAMVRLYSEILDYASDAYAAMFAALARGEGAALLLCSAGKDRTGVGAALLLAALGVTTANIAADFLLSADCYRGQEENFARRHGYDRTGHPLALFRDVFTVHPDYFEALVAAATERDGSLADCADSLIAGSAAQAALVARFTEIV